MSTFKGYFLGFEFNGVHSSDLEIVRINQGSRAELPLTPSFQDQTLSIPGRDGLIYFNTQIQQYTFNLNFAYDNLSEERIRKIREVFRAGVVGKLIFDELPYKEYTVKVSAQPKLDYLVFNETRNGGSSRTYKGEGTISFVAYYPYAKSRFKNASEYGQGNIKDRRNKQDLKEGTEYEWLESAGFKEIEGVDTYTTTEQGGARMIVYNGGDYETPFEFSMGVQAGNYYGIDCRQEDSNIDGKRIYFKATKSGTLLFNTEYHTVFINGELDNSQVVAGHFFKLPKGESTLVFTMTSPSEASISYDYLYN